MEVGEAIASTAGVTVTLSQLIEAYLKDYDIREFRSANTARGRVAHLRRFFKEECLPREITPQRIRDYQVERRKEGAATATINRETSALSRMCRIGVELGWLTSVPTFPGRLRENPPRQGFFEHYEYIRVRKHLPAPYQDVLDFAYYSGWRKHEILDLTWNEIDRDGGVIRLSPDRSKTQLGRAGVPERVAMILTGHKTRAVFDRYNIVNERELLTAGEQLVDYLSKTRGGRQDRNQRW